MIRKYLDDIITSGNKDDMLELNEILIESLEHLKTCDPECYKKFKMDIIGMANKYKFNEEIAVKIVNDMKPLGEKWSIDEITKTAEGIDKNDLYDFYVVMNSLANDYGKVLSTDDIDTYVKMAWAFIKDEDAKDHKVWNYFVNIPK